MCKESTRISILSVLVSLSLCSVAFALCYETSGGKLQAGSIEKHIPNILRSYESDVPNGAVYTIQKKEGFYFKVCDESVQVAHFMEKWVYPKIPNGDWHSILTTTNKAKIQRIKDAGIYKIKKDGKNWIIWSYVNMDDKGKTKGNSSKEISWVESTDVRFDGNIGFSQDTMGTMEDLIAKYKGGEKGAKIYADGKIVDKIGKVLAVFKETPAKIVMIGNSEYYQFDEGDWRFRSSTNRFQKDSKVFHKEK